MLRYLIAFCILATYNLTSALPDYKQQVPNGHRVPHPCFSNTVWEGVGHLNAEGGGALNPFGEDFRDNGFIWNSVLCAMDSDGDGRTNGEELGDPLCIWDGVELPNEIDGITHPGVCEPLDDPDCTNNWDVCKAIEFQCDNVDNDPGIEEVSLRFQELDVPNVETSYYCQVVEFEDTKEMHAVAMEPIIDNRDIVHHMDLHACSDPELSDYVKTAYATPKACDVMTGCGGNLLAAWALGITGICIQDKVGMRVGKNGDTVAILRIHYHNPFLKENQTDTSGLLMYVTENLRENDAQIINAGQAYLEIPPGFEYHAADALCHGDCTAEFRQDIFLMFGAMHMHYLGTGGFSEIWRDGAKVQTIMSQDFYDYNAPHIQYFDPPIKLTPGDEIRYTCNYQSRDRTRVTYRGESAMDEMCNIYLVYYPAQNLSRCSADGELHSCKFRYEEKKRFVDMADCDWNNYRALYDAHYKPAVYDACDRTGSQCYCGSMNVTQQQCYEGYPNVNVTGQQCYESCAEVVDFVLNNHTCLTGNARDATISKYDEDFMFAMHSCKDYTVSAEEEESNGHPGKRLTTYTLLLAVMSLLLVELLN